MPNRNSSPIDWVEISSSGDPLLKVSADFNFLNTCLLPPPAQLICQSDMVSRNCIEDSTTNRTLLQQIILQAHFAVAATCVTQVDDN